MRKLIYFVLPFLLTIDSYSQPEVEFVRIFDGGGSTHDKFADIYTLPDDGYIMCGYANGGNNDIWVMRVDNDGELEWSRTFGGGAAHSIIQTDNNDFLIGGGSDDQFMATLISEDGEEIWRRNYVPGSCKAVIELKSSEFVLVGKIDIDGNPYGYIVEINEDGDVIWARQYSAPERNGRGLFRSMRETEGGVVVAGASLNTWALKIDFEGEPIWSNIYDVSHYSSCRAIVSSPGGGFALAGMADVRGDFNVIEESFLLKIDDDGNQEWLRKYNDETTEYCFGLTAINQSGYMMVGWLLVGGHGGHYAPHVLRTTSQGVLRWRQVYDFGVEEGFNTWSSRWNSVVKGNDNSIIVAGYVYRDTTLYDGIIMKIEPEQLEPILFYWLPEDTMFSVLLGDSVQFIVRARDQQGDELSYLWILGEDSLREDTTYTEYFEELGEFEVQCQVSDGEFTSAVTWHVSVVEWYVQGFTPDSLDFTIRRGREVDFALDIAAIEGVDLNFSWTHVDRNQRRHEIGAESNVSFDFIIPGDQTIEGLVWNDDGSEETVHWRVQVNSAVFYWFPRELEFSVLMDTTIDFSMFPFNPDSDSLRYLWELDGDSLDDYRVTEVHFPDEGLHEVTGYTWDGAEVDTIRWTVNVIHPDRVGDSDSALLPGQVILYPPVPNPFNSTTRIEYALPIGSDVSIRLYGQDGRLVRVLEDGFARRGVHSMTINGNDLSSGLYFVRMTIENEVLTQKVLLIR